jgi:Protein of unknown function (DUF3300)
VQAICPRATIFNQLIFGPPLAREKVTEDGMFLNSKDAHLKKPWSRAAAALFLAAAGAPLNAQAPLPVPAAPYERPATPPSYSAAELDRILGPIALYPDPLLANVLTAATFPDDIPEAARWADEHHRLSGGQLTAAIVADDVPWDPSVQALLPFPNVLEMMASDMPWTEEIGDAFLGNHDAVMEAVQRLRHTARDAGYLHGCSSVVVSPGPYVEIMPADPTYITVPYYFPKLFAGPPPAGMVVYCGYGVRLGAWFSPWGWGAMRILWPNGTVVIDGQPWGRTWVNRDRYVHPFAAPQFRAPRPPERHREQPRTPREREREQPKGAPPRGAPLPNPPKASPPQGTPPERPRK